MGSKSSGKQTAQTYFSHEERHDIVYRIDN